MSKQNLLNILDRPNEPLYLPKGDGQVVFNVPDNFVTDDRYKGAGLAIRDKGGESVDVKQFTPPSNFSSIEQLGKREIFSTFVPLHRRLAGQLIELFMAQKTTDDLQAAALYAREHVNSQLFNYAFSVSLLHRPDTKDIDIPPLAEFFPEKFVDSGIFNRAREEANINSAIPGINSAPLEIPLDYTASDLEEEHRVAYFREDIGINLHHWHWHLVYPFSGPRDIVAKDRRGELFYYMHEQLVARYNAERLSNKLARVTRLLELREPLPEGYFPKLDSLSSSRVWASRLPNTLLKDINREADQLKFDIIDLERWRDRLYEAVHTGRITDSQGQSVQLTEANGIDILGNLIEASSLSMNPNLYGDLHNFGHIAIALSHDPDHRHLETFSVMGDSATAMRDPIFYRWHAFIDDIFQEHKNTLPRYTRQQLEFDGMQVTGIEVNSQGFPRNELNTFWQQNDVNLTRGMDFSPRGNVFARFTHLQHVPFEYRVQVNNTGQARQGTVRIFIAPTREERGLPLLFNDQRKMMIELDKFVHNFQPGQNTVTRRSNQSSVTIPFERTFRNLNAGPTTTSGLAEFNYCGCGWPQHMLIPKGNAEGLRCTLFVMISNFADDRVDNPPRSDIQCTGAVSYCGLRASRYPDRRSMGYPFDRSSQAGVDTLQQFLLPNMRTQDVVIKFTNRIHPPGSILGQKPGQQGNKRPTGGRN